MAKLFRNIVPRADAAFLTIHAASSLAELNGGGLLLLRRRRLQVAAIDHPADSERLDSTHQTLRLRFSVAPALVSVWLRAGICNFILRPSSFASLAGGILPTANV